MNLQGKAAVVTGSSRGVGRATALMLARRGCAVLINYHTAKASAEDLAREIAGLGGKAVCVQADVADESACRKMIDVAADAFGRIDILVNNAGTTEFLPFNDLSRLTEDHWDRIFDVNVKGAFWCARAARPHLDLAPEGGQILNVTSVAGMIGAGSSIAYCASKAALINLTLSLARTLAPRIRVNAIAPGFIADDWTKAGLGASYEAVKTSREKGAALGKVCTPEDVADAIIAVLAGSDLVTGQNIVVDGGGLVGGR